MGVNRYNKQEDVIWYIQELQKRVEKLERRNTSAAPTLLSVTEPWPTELATGDHAKDVGTIWIDASDNNLQKRWEDGNWNPVRDGGIEQAISDAAAATDAALPDGIVPATTPTVLVYGGVGVIHVRHPGITNPDPVSYKYHISTTTGFTPDITTLAITSPSTATTIKAMPNGTPLLYGVTYYIKVIPFDADGDGPTSTQVSASLYQIGNTEINSGYTYFGNVVFDQMVGGTLSSDVTLSATVSTRTAGVGAGTDVTIEGIDIYDSTGTPATSLHPDQSKFKGDGEFNSLTATGPATIRHTLEVAKSAEGILREGTTAPVSPPSTVMAWPGTISGTFGFSGNYGLHWTGTEWVSIGGQYGPEIHRSISGMLTLPGGSPLPWGGIVKIGTDWYTLGWRAIPDSMDYEWLITRYNSSGIAITQTSYTPVSAIMFDDMASGIGIAAIGTDGTNVLICEFDDANNRFRIQVRSASTLALSSTVNTGANAGFTGTVMGIIGGNFDFGSFRYCVLSRNGHHVWVFTSAGTYNAVEAFPVPAPAQCSGLTWDGTRFWTTNARTAAQGLTQIYKHTTYTWNDQGDLKTHWVTSTWRDTDSTGGTHETDMGTVKSFAMKKRAAVTLTSAAIPDLGGTDDPNAVSFYLGIVSAVRTNLWRQTLPADDVNTITIGDAMTFAGTNPPAANDFPNATPAVWRNDNSTLLISGDGSIDGLHVSEAGDPVVREVATASIANDTGGVYVAGTETARLEATIPAARVGTKYRVYATATPSNGTAGGFMIGRLRWHTVTGGVTGTVFSAQLVDHRLAARPEQLNVMGDFIWAGTDGVPVYVKFTFNPGGGTGGDNAGTHGPTKMWVDAIG